MKAKYFLITGTFALCIVAIGCSNDDEPETQSGCLDKSWGEQTKNEADAVSAAATTFATTPSKATCESFRAAYIDYIEALEKLEPCVLPAQRNDFSQALDQGKAELLNLDCNQEFQS